MLRNVGLKLRFLNTRTAEQNLLSSLPIGLCNRADLFSCHDAVSSEQDERKSAVGELLQLMPSGEFSAVGRPQSPFRFCQFEYVGRKVPKEAYKFNFFQSGVTGKRCVTLFL